MKILKHLTFVLAGFLFTGCNTILTTGDAGRPVVELTSSDVPPSGLCRIYSENKLMFEGTLASGKMDGAWAAWNSQGVRIVICTYQQGVRSGLVQMWYGGLSHPEDRWRLKLEGTFLDGVYHGIVTNYSPTDASQLLREYEHGTLKKAWHANLPSGTVTPPDEAQAKAITLLKDDLDYLTMLEGMVNQALTEGQRKIRQ